VKAKLNSYSKTYDTTLKFTKGIWTSEATEKLKQSLGIEVVFHHKEDKPPFGYTIIDHPNQTVYKGSEVLKLKDFLSLEEINQQEKGNFNVPDLSSLSQLFSTGGQSGGEDEGEEQKQDNSPNRRRQKR
jgi:hypothetical protein